MADRIVQRRRDVQSLAARHESRTSPARRAEGRKDRHRSGQGEAGPQGADLGPRRRPMKPRPAPRCQPRRRTAGQLPPRRVVSLTESDRRQGVGEGSDDTHRFGRGVARCRGPRAAPGPRPGCIRGNDAFEAEFAGMAEDAPAVAFHMLDINEPVGRPRSTPRRRRLRSSKGSSRRSSPSSSSRSKAWY